MKPPKPKPLKPTTRWAIVDMDGELQWVAPQKRNSRRHARSRLDLLRIDGDRITRVLITEVASGLAR